MASLHRERLQTSDSPCAHITFQARLSQEGLCYVEGSPGTGQGGTRLQKHTSIDLKPQLQRLSSVHNAIRDTRDPEPQKDAGAKAHAAASGAQRAPTIAAPASAA